MKLDLSVVITFHLEGKIAADTIESVKQSLNNCNFEYEIIAHIDKGDELTTKTVEKAFVDIPNVRIFKNSFGDLSRSRNFCTEMARGKLISFMDGDDLISDNWYNEAYKTLQRFPGVVVHPQYNVTFGDGKNRVWKMRNSLSDKRDKFILVRHNLWCATSVMPTSVVKKYPYTPFRPGFGYEDWLFNANTRSAGIEHKVAKDTVLYYRVASENSLYKESQMDKLALPKSPEFSTKYDGKSLPVLRASLFGTRIKDKVGFIIKRTKVGRAINNSVGATRISTKAKKDMQASGLLSAPIIYADSYNSERPLVGKYYYKLSSLFDNKTSKYAFDVKMASYKTVDFEHITNGLNNDEKELLLTQLIVQNNVAAVVFPKSDFYRLWVKDHEKLINTLKLKVNEQL